MIAALRWAWAELVRDDSPLVNRGDEESVTARLEELLNARVDGKRRVPWLRDWESVTRGASQKTADGRLGKKPDLTFRPIPYPAVLNTTRWGWFIECKIVDGAASIAAYRDQGVQRFSAGEYAAWMPSGAMLAYVRDDSTPIPTLEAALNESVGTIHHRAGPTADRSESTHGRLALPNPCVDVTLIHLWLRGK